MYFLEPHWANPEGLTAAQHQAALVWLPSFWFLGLFQKLNGSVPSAPFSLASRAIVGVLTATLGAGTAFLLCYIRTLRKIIEEPEITPTRRRISWSPPLGGLTETAVALFSIRTLLRSRQHRAIVCFYLGIGFSIVILYLKTGIARATSRELAASSSWRQPGLPLLVSSVVLICVAVLGTRMAFSMPADVRANWIFRLLPLRRLPDLTDGARRGLIMLACIPIWAVFVILFLSIWPWRAAVLHLGILALVALVLSQAAMLGFRKIPFTCSYLPGKANVYLAVWTYTMLGIPLIDLCVRWEWRALHSVRSSVAIMVGLALIAGLLRLCATLLSREQGLRFEESPEPAIVALDLHQDGELVDTAVGR